MPENDTADRTEQAERTGNRRALQQLEEITNKMTGVFGPGSLILPPSQAGLERAFLFFAPRYTRASLAVVKEAFSPNSGISARVARQSLLRLIGVGVAMYWTYATALGQEPKLDPRPKTLGGDGADFLTLGIGGDRVGIGSFWTSFARTAASIGFDPAFQGDTGDSPLLFTTDEVGGKNIPDRIADNPVIRWGRNRTAVLTGTGWDIVTGEDAIGNPIEGPVGVAGHIGSQGLPFALENVVLGRPERSGFAAGGAEVFGLRSFPISLSARRRLLEDRLAQQHEGVNWDSLNDLQKDRIRDSDEELQLLTERARKDRVIRGEKIDAQVETYFAEIEENEEHWKGLLMRHVETAQSGYINMPELRQRIQDANLVRRDGRNRIDNDSEFDIVREWLVQQGENPGSEDRPEDVAYDEYLTSVFLDPVLDRPEGFDFDEQERRIRAFEESHPDWINQYVRERLAEGKGIPPLIEELFKGRDKFSYYWGSPQDLNSVVGKVIDSRSDSVIVGQLYEQWRDSLDRSAFEKAHPTLKNTLNVISRVRLELRRRDPKLDAFMFRWGFTDTLRHEVNQSQGDRDFWRTPYDMLAFFLQPNPPEIVEVQAAP